MQLRVEAGWSVRGGDRRFIAVSQESKSFLTGGNSSCSSPFHVPFFSCFFLTESYFYAPVVRTKLAPNRNPFIELEGNLTIYSTSELTPCLKFWFRSSIPMMRSFFCSQWVGCGSTLAQCDIKTRVSSKLFFLFVLFLSSFTVFQLKLNHVI